MGLSEDFEEVFRRTGLAAPKVVLVPMLPPVDDDDDDEDEAADGRLPHPSAAIGRSRMV